jgi:hypothetical protein
MFVLYHSSGPADGDGAAQPHPGAGGGGGQQPQLPAGLSLSEGASGSPQGPKQGAKSPVQCSKMVGKSMVGN